MSSPFNKTTLSNLPFPRLLELLGQLPATPSPWAVLLVRFQDNPMPLPDMTIYKDLFTSAGVGKQGMVDCFHDMSHGKLDLSGTKLLGWYTLPYNRSAYVGNGVAGKGQLDRGGLVAAAKAVATAAGVDLSLFSGVLVNCLGQVDLCGFVGGMAAICDSLSLEPSLLGQEMGHGYGLDHARLQGSMDDYRDPWDLMSTAEFPSMEEDNKEFTKIGPGLNAWNMRSRGWLDEARVWSSPSGAFSGTVQIRPLHRTDLLGFLAVQVGIYLVEFRVPQRWDAAIGAATVLIHRFEDNHSYLMTTTTGDKSFEVGSKFEIGNPQYALLPFFSVEVTAIDPANLTATVHVVMRPAAPVPSVVGQLFGAVGADGGGSIYVNGQFHPVPPRGLFSDLVSQVARVASVQTYQTGVGGAIASQRAALEDVVRAAVAMYREADPISEAPPGYRGAVQQREEEADAEV